MDGDKTKVSLTVNSEELIFSNIDELKSYLMEELECWKWMREMRDVGPVANDLYNKFVMSQLSPLINRITGGDPISDFVFMIRDLDYPYIASGSEEGKLIDRARYEQGNVAALFLFIYLSPDSQVVIKRSSAIKKFVEDGQYSYERAFALKLIMANIEFGRISCDARFDSNDELAERFSQKVNESFGTLDEFEGDVRLKLSDIENTYQERFFQIDRNLSRRIERYKSVASSVKADTKKKLSDAQQDLISAKDAYHDQVDLDASVQYWDSRLRAHTKAKYYWLLTVVAFMAITFFGLITYYGYGAVSGLSKSLYSAPIALDSKSQAITNIESGKKGNEAAEAARLEQLPDKSVLMGRTPSELSLAMADLVGAALALTLFGVLIRIGLRQFNSHSHCALDASERVTFVKTYLALLGEGKLKSDEDRRVILESLFRTTQPGMTSEIPFSSPIELILKTIGDRKP